METSGIELDVLCDVNEFCRCLASVLGTGPHQRRVRRAPVERPRGGPLFPVPIDRCVIAPSQSWRWT